MDALALTSCDREPIHIPGAIQPHGLFLVADAATLTITGGAGDLEGRLSPDWLNASLESLLGREVTSQLAGDPNGARSVVLDAPVAGAREQFDVIVHRDEGRLLVELEPAPVKRVGAMALLWSLDQLARTFEQSTDFADICRRAARAVQQITDFERVMVYRFLDDGSGQVIAEASKPGLGGFLNHHFPAGDIPRQARALYVRNRSRLIPDVNYTPAPLRPAAMAGLDLSDVGLRSVSPVHLQYLRNMGVGASASFSIVREGALWGLIACHSEHVHHIPRETMVAATALANALGRQVGARENREAYGRRLRLRATVDDLLVHFRDERPFDQIIDGVGDNLRRAFEADGLVFINGAEVRLWGIGPAPAALRKLAAWALQQSQKEPLVTRTLAQRYPEAESWPHLASGLMALSLAQEGRALIWLRVEQVEEVRWAGDPARIHAAQPDMPLSPRRSFETWVESVRFRARPWGSEVTDAARRLIRGIDEARFHRRLRLLNRELRATIEERNALLAQQELMMREVDHRVQNSLQMVSAFFRLQAKEAGPGPVAEVLAEAQARLAAISLLHRKLYTSDQTDTIELGGYLRDLIGDLRKALGREWAPMVQASIDDFPISTSRAVAIGVVMTELVINATKYAYGGLPGPIDVALERRRHRFRLTVADQGKGAAGGAAVQGTGFGGRLINGTIARLKGTMEHADNAPGLRITLEASIDG